MILNAKYHGNIEYNETDIIFFEKGLAGFETLKKYILFDLEGNNFFSILHSIEDLSLGFVLVSPFSVIGEYEFELTLDNEKELKIEKSKDIKVLTTVTLNSDIEKFTTNLKAPIIINNISKLGKQIILSDDKYLLKYPLITVNSCKEG